MKVVFGDLLPGETPIDDATGLKVPGIVTRTQLGLAEAENIRKALVKYFGGELTEELAPLDLTWAKRLLPHSTRQNGALLWFIGLTASGLERQAE